MTVYEAARELGVKLSETPQGKRLADARYIFDGNEEAQNLFFSYRDAREDFIKKSQKCEITEEDKENFTLKTEAITRDPIISELLSAENEFAQLTDTIFNIVRATAEGEFPESSSGGCGGNCASCGGCG